MQTEKPGPVLTAAEMREADRRCIEELGIPSAVLMACAGAAVFDAVRGPRAGIVAGKGNNGGDGFVAALKALAAGYETHAVLLGAIEDVKGDGRIFLDAYRKLGGRVVEATDEDAVRTAVKALAGCDTLVDAILGTGVTGEIRGLPRAAIEAWPSGYTVAVDQPSGMNTDTGFTGDACIHADVTVTFQFRKRGFEAAPREVIGEVRVVDIGIPPVCADDNGWAAVKAKWTA